MKAPDELTAEANDDEILNNMRWELSLVGLNTGEINQQVDALIEDNYQLQNKGWGSVRFAYTDDQIVDKQRDTPVPAGTCCLGTPELAPSKMKVVSRERKRTQTIRNEKKRADEDHHRDDYYQAITTKGAAHEKPSSPAAPILLAKQVLITPPVVPY
jgi:hypothetical protein